MDDRLLTYLSIHLLIVATVDITLGYFFINSLLAIKIKESLKKIDFKRIGCAFTILILVVPLRLFAVTFDLAYLSFFIIGLTIAVIPILTIKISKKDVTFDESMLFLISYFIVNQSIVTLSIMPRAIFPDLLENSFLFILVGATLIFILLMDKLQLNKVALFISYRLAFKIAVFAIFLLLLSITLFIMLIENVTVYNVIAPLILIIVFAVLGFIHTLKVAHQYEIVVPEKYDDMKKILTLLNVNAKYAKNEEELSHLISVAIELMGVVKLSAPTIEHADEEFPKDVETFIKTSVETLKLNHNATADVLMNIQFFEPHKKVSAMTLNYMLTTLLENAFDTKTSYPIKIDVLSTSHIMLIKVANETTRLDDEALKNMLKKGYSTKGRVGRGFGLSKLKKLVESHDGTITINQETDASTQMNYISFTLNF